MFTRSLRHPINQNFLFLVVGILFFATGACSLIYQVVWQRYLLNLFGATIYSISTVLAAFMGGLALGSFLLGRIADKARSPLRLYGVLELGVGLAACIVPVLLRALDPIFVWAYKNWGSNFFAYSFARFVFVFLILLVPTTLMGGTLPLLSRFVSPLGKMNGTRIGLLYALNTCGAVAGTIAAGFYFLRWWGISTTIALAVGVNIFAGIVAIGLSLGTTGTAGNEENDPHGEEAAHRDAHTLTPHQRRAVFFAYFISGLAALGLEVVWSRALVFTFELLKNTTYSFTAMLSVFLVGIAVGSAAASPFVEKDKHPYRTFAILQIVIGLVSVCSFFVLYHFCYTLGASWLDLVNTETGSIRWTQTLFLVFLRSAVVVFPPTFLMGFAFPYAVRCIALSASAIGVGTEVGRLYSLNTVGAILGSFATGFLLLPFFGIANTIWGLGTLQAISGCTLTLIDKREPAARRYTWLALAVASLAVTYVRIPRPTIFQPLEPLEKMIFYKEGPLATVSVTENSLGYRTIFVDNVGVAGTEPMLLTDQKSLAHVPMLLLKNPKSALTVGFGSGGASYSYTLHPELETIDCVEITKTVIEAAPTLVDSNHDVVMQRDEYLKRTGKLPEGIPLWNDGGRSGWYKSDRRYNIILDDVRSYLHFTDKRYDIIATDCTDLRYKSNANLYDLEYFTLCRNRITEDGMVVVWMPLAGLSDEAFRVALRTFYRVFPNMEVFYMNNEPTHYILLIGTKSPLTVDLDTMRRKLQNPRVNADLEELHLNSAEKILSCFVCGREALKGYLAGDLLNTEDFPYLEFESPRFGYGDSPILMNLDSLFQVREHPAKLLERPTSSPEEVSRLERYAAAVPDIIEGHKHYRRVELELAAQCWMRALAINPEDKSVRHLLDFEELRRKVKGQPLNLWAKYALAQVLILQGRDTEAVSYLNDLIKTATSQPGLPKADVLFREACTKLADIYEKRGKKSESEKLRRDAMKGLATNSLTMYRQ